MRDDAFRRVRFQLVHPLGLSAPEPVNGPIRSEDHSPHDLPRKMVFENFSELILVQLTLKAGKVEIDVWTILRHQRGLSIQRHAGMAQDEIDVGKVQRGIVDAQRVRAFERQG